MLRSSFWEYYIPAGSQRKTGGLKPGKADGLGTKSGAVFRADRQLRVIEEDYRAVFLDPVEYRQIQHLHGIEQVAVE